MHLTFGEYVGIIAFLLVIFLQLYLHITGKSAIEINFKKKH